VKDFWNNDTGQNNSMLWLLNFDFDFQHIAALTHGRNTEAPVEASAFLKVK
jgi:hypothetical protein